MKEMGVGVRRLRWQRTRVSPGVRRGGTDLSSRPGARELAFSAPTESEVSGRSPLTSGIRRYPQAHVS